MAASPASSKPVFCAVESFARLDVGGEMAANWKMGSFYFGLKCGGNGLDKALVRLFGDYAAVYAAFRVRRPAASVPLGG